MPVIDVHTHCFPDFLTEKVMARLTVSPEMIPHHNGSLSGLLDSMDQANIDQAVVQSIATRPEQTENILQWSLSIRNERIIPFISVHPQYKNYDQILQQAAAEGIRGVKVHPHFQDFDLDNEDVYPLYEAFCKYDLLVFFHAGTDLSYPGRDNASVERIHKVISLFPQMKTILAHCGGYREWDKVEELLAGKDVFLETSFILEEAGEEKFLRILNKHSKDKILFGTDSPWNDQAKAIQLMNNTRLDEEIKNKIFYRNFKALTG